MNVFMTMSLVMLTFILFRSDNISDACHYYGRLFSSSFFTVPIIPNGTNIILSVLPFLSIMLLVEWLQREKDHGLQIDGIRYSFVRWVIYYSIFLSILQFNNEDVQFIYYQY
jgi:alginate O-acetyltransferase complex protein AlgI